MTSAFSLPAGTRIGRYELIRGLASGGMGEVYLGRLSSESASRLVAVKVLRGEYLADDELRALFRSEAATLLRLDHTSVVRAIELVSEAGRDALVMEYVRGHSAAALLQAWRERPPASLALAVELVARVARAVDYVHGAKGDDGQSLGLVHRDLSPDNIMLRPDGTIKLIDFGIARRTLQTAVTSAGVLKGKVSYMSPEQLRQDPLDRRSDVFQLGTLLYELSTRAHPFSANNFAATMNAILSGDVADPREHAPTLDPELAAVIVRALEFEPEDRYPTAAALAEALEAHLDAKGQRVREGDLTAELLRVLGDAPAESASSTRIDVSKRRRLPPRARVWPYAFTSLGVAAFAVAWLQRARVSGVATEASAMRALSLAWTLAGVGVGLVLVALVLWMRDRRRRAAMVVGLALSSTGCGAPERPCDQRAPCDLREGGYCDAAAMRCAYPDDTCPSGFAYGPFGGEATGCTPAWDPTERAYATPVDDAVSLDGDPSELTLGRPLTIASDFGVQASVWFRTDARGLHVAATIRDPQLEATAPPYQPLWDDDGIEILFDTDWDRATGAMPGVDDYKFVVTAINATSVSWGGVTPRTAWSIPIASAVRTRGTVNQPADVDEGYDVELFIPWSEGFERPEPGRAWGVNVRINDLHGGASRNTTWRDETPLNHPAGAGTLIFGLPPSDPVGAPREPRPSPPPFERLPLKDAVRSVSADLRASQPIDQAFDGCLAPRRPCMVATDRAPVLTVEFDLGSVRTLAAARLFGDTRHDWVSRTWTVRVRASEEEPWTAIIQDAPASFDGWHFARALGHEARYVQLTVTGDTGHGVEFREFELLGRERSPAHEEN